MHAHMRMKSSLKIITGLSLILLLAFGLAWVSNRFLALDGWGSFLAVLLLGGGIMVAGWGVLQRETPPGWLASLIILAALLRLGAGVLWFSGLPEWGYASPAEQSGYVMADALDRDQAAWELASSGKPLLRAYQGAYRRADQYGGLLFFSALIYRFLGGAVHQPLLMVVFTAAFSALMVGFVWAFARRSWPVAGGQAVARLSAWGMAFYPEAILLGSSQMREAFTMCFAILALWALMRYLDEERLVDLGLMLVALGGIFFFSPPFTGLLLIFAGAFALVSRPRAFWRSLLTRRWSWLVVLILVAASGAGMWLAWRDAAPAGITNPLALFGWWVRKSADLQALMSKQLSGWMQKVFALTPAWSHMPMLVLYGVVQPFLPAALMDISGAPVWWGIAVWRSAGWALLLPLLLYAPFQVFKVQAFQSVRPLFGRRWLAILIALVWVGILIAAFRGGGDQWDNPRYRATSAGLQIVLAAWVTVTALRRKDAWLRRTLVGAGLALTWFLPWYLRRYTAFEWPVESFFKTIGLGLFSAVLYILGDWIAEASRRIPD